MDMPQLIFFAIIAAVAYVGYRAFLREAQRVTAKVRRAERERQTGTMGTLVKDPKTGRIPAREGLRRDIGQFLLLASRRPTSACRHLLPVIGGKDALVSAFVNHQPGRIGGKIAAGGLLPVYGEKCPALR
jgi:hypothetical protein